MCDTLGFVAQGSALFAKNSDRSPNEVQIPEYYPAAVNTEKTVQTTYNVIPQGRESHAVLLSRPSWMWGAEMGVNDCGVCIGNEAVFTKGKYSKDDGLTGMDMLRVALERAGDAKTASYIIISLLQQYGQGGNCGYDHEFYYDNSFLIMDRNELYVLESCGREWVRKKTDRACISNRLTIHSDGEKYSGKACDFAAAHTEPVFTFFSGSADRIALTGKALETAESAADCMAALRQHKDGVSNPFAKGTVASPCMHFGGLVGDHSTASMVTQLLPDRTVVWATGSSLPCVSLFKPWLFGTKPAAAVFSPEDPAGEEYWRGAERYRRSLLGREIPKDFYAERDEIEEGWLKESASVPDEAFTEFSLGCAETEKSFYEKWNPERFRRVSCAPGFNSRWAKKNKVFEEES